MVAAAWIGTLPAWFAFAGVLALAIALRGGQIGPAVGYLRETNRTLTEEISDLKAKLAEERKLNAQLKATRDLEPLQVAVIAAIEHHEKASAVRDERVFTILDLIASRLGPNTNH